MLSVINSTVLIKMAQSNIDPNVTGMMYVMVASYRQQGFSISWFFFTLYLQSCPSQCSVQSHCAIPHINDVKVWTKNIVDSEWIKKTIISRAATKYKNFVKL